MDICTYTGNNSRYYSGRVISNDVYHMETNTSPECVHGCGTRVW